MNKRKWIILCIMTACLLLIGTAIWIFTSHYLNNKNTRNIDWALHGYLVTADGQIQNELAFSVSGSIRENKDDSNDDLKLAFQFPDSFRYSSESEREYPGNRSIHDAYHYYVSAGTAYDKTKNAPVALYLALDAENEYLIMHWNDDSDLYLVASVDKTQPAQLLKHFQKFLDNLNRSE